MYIDKRYYIQVDHKTFKSYPSWNDLFSMQRNLHAPDVSRQMQTCTRKLSTYYPLRTWLFSGITRLWHITAVVASSRGRREIDRWSLISKQSSTSFSMCLFFRSACNYIKYFGGDENNNEEKEEEKEGTKNILHKTACDRVCQQKEKVG